jgi:hypothetical protein
MSNTAKAMDWSRRAEAEDSWKSPVRMLYRVTIEVRDGMGSRFYFLQVANYHNAEAIQQVFECVDDASSIDVTFAPDVVSYVGQVYPHLEIDSVVLRNPSDDDCDYLSTPDQEDENDYV